MNFPALISLLYLYYNYIRWIIELKIEHFNSSKYKFSPTTGKKSPGAGYLPAELGTTVQVDRKQQIISFKKALKFRSRFYFILNVSRITATSC